MTQGRLVSIVTVAPSMAFWAFTAVPAISSFVTRVTEGSPSMSASTEPTWPASPSMARWPQKMMSQGSPLMAAASAEAVV